MNTAEIVARVDQIAAGLIDAGLSVDYMAIYEEVAEMAGVTRSDVADAIAADVMAAVRAG